MSKKINLITDFDWDIGVEIPSIPGMEKHTKALIDYFKDKIKTPEDFMAHWDEHKNLEGKKRESVLDGTPNTLPALLKAHRLQSKASRVGFDWERIEDVFKKLDEEIGEFKRALSKKDREKTEDEIGDIFFILVRISNFVGVNPEDALRKTSSKFIRRFMHVERRASEQGRKLSDMTLEEMDVLLEEAKKNESLKGDS